MRPVLDQDNSGISLDDPRLHGWYHTIDLGDGVHSSGWYDLRSVVDRWGIPESLEGLDVLDVGTADGFFAFEMERRGARRVVAVDVPAARDQDWLPDLVAEQPATNPNTERFHLARRLRHSNVEHVEMSAYDISAERLGTFDLVFCGSLLLHLRDPLRALIAIRSVARRLAIIETAGDPELDDAHPDRPWLRFGNREFEQRLGDHCTYWTMSSTALEDMLEYAGFRSFTRLPRFALPPHGLMVTCIHAYTDASAGTPPRPRERERGMPDQASEVARLRAELSAVTESRSWRFTAPLRRFSQLVRGRRVDRR